MSRSKYVLVVDDDPEILRIVSALLGQDGFRVIAVQGATDALPFLSNDLPDVILTDIHMAEGDGFELINAVRERDLRIPVIAMSGGSGTFGSDSLDFAKKLGAVAILDKPFRGTQLRETVDRAIQEGSSRFK